jgi:cytochrome c6
MSILILRAGCGAILLFLLTLVWGQPLQAQGAAATFNSKCSGCHSADGSGSGAMGKQLGVKDLRSSDVQKQTDAQLIATITNGDGQKMPAYKGKLTDAEITGVVGYLRDLAKKK